MTEQQRKRGPAATQIEGTGENVRANVVRLRKAHGMTTYALAKALAERGRPIPQSGISRIESGARRVDVDDLTALAVVFGVSPAALLLPLTTCSDDPVAVTGAGEVDALKAWRWGIGSAPLRLRNPEREVTELQEFSLFGLPQWLSDHIRFTHLASAKLGPSAEGRRAIADLKERHRLETGEELDVDAILNRMLGVEPEGGDG